MGGSDCLTVCCRGVPRRRAFVRRRLLLQMRSPWRDDAGMKSFCDDLASLSVVRCPGLCLGRNRCCSLLNCRNLLFFASCIVLGYLKTASGGPQMLRWTDMPRRTMSQWASRSAWNRSGALWPGPRSPEWHSSWSCQWPPTSSSQHYWTLYGATLFAWKPTPAYGLASPQLRYFTFSADERCILMNYVFCGEICHHRKLQDYLTFS